MQSAGTSPAPDRRVRTLRSACPGGLDGGLASIESSGFDLEPPFVIDAQGEINAADRTETTVQPREVHFDGLARYVEAHRDFVIGDALQHQGQDLALTNREGNVAALRIA